MVNQIVIVAVTLLITGIILLVLAFRKKEETAKEIEIAKNPLDIIQQEKNQNKQLIELTKFLKKYLKENYKIKETNSLNEIILELEKEDIKEFIEICKDLNEYYYSTKKPTKKDIERLIERLRIEIKFIEIIKKQENLIKEKNKTFLDRMKEREEKIKKEITDTKINNSKDISK